MMNGVTATTTTPGPCAPPRVGSKHDVPADGFIRLAPKTHDISLSDEHIPSISHLAADLEKAVKAGWSRRHDIRYSKVQVLTLRWEDDDLGVITELKALGHVFADLYHYEVQTYSIPSEKPDKELKRRILNFLEHDGPETLLIIYYAGHAISSLQANEAPIWSANRHIGSPSLPSAGIQSMFEEADADVLLLYDCCNSAATRASSSYQEYRGVTEVIAACGYEAIAPEVGEHSFSTALTEVLAAASKGAPPTPFSIAELHTRILNRLKCWAPSFVKDDNGKFKEDLNGRLEYERQPRRTPIYSILCETEPRRSIVLAPLKNIDPPNADSQPNDVSLQLGHDSPSQPIYPAHFGNDDRPKKRKRPIDEDVEYPQVLLAIRLDKHELDLDAWKECLLRQLPTEAKDIKIEGVYASFSTLLLLRLSVAVWDLLPANPAYSFIGFVTSENKAIAASPAYSSASTSVDTKTQRSGEASLGETKNHSSAAPVDPDVLTPYNHPMTVSNSASPSYHIADSPPEYSNYQPSESSKIEDNFFGVSFDAGVQRTDSLPLPDLPGVGFHTAQLNERDPTLVATSSVNPGHSNILNSPKRNILSPPASTRSSSPSRDPLPDSVSESVSGDVTPAIFNRPNPFEDQSSIPGRPVSDDVLVQPDSPRLKISLSPQHWSLHEPSQSQSELLNETRSPETREDSGDVEIPSLNEQAEQRRIDMTNLELQEWRSEVGESNDTLDENFDAQNSYRMDPTEGESDIPPVSDDLSIHENRLVEGQVYYNLESLASAESDIEMLNQMRYWSDPPSLPYMTNAHHQPLSANAAIMKFHQKSDLYSLDSRRASWGTTRAPFQEIEPNVASGSIFKRFSFKKKNSVQESRTPDRQLSPFDQGIARLAELADTVRSRVTSTLRKRRRSSPLNDYDTSGSMKRIRSQSYECDTSEKGLPREDLSNMDSSPRKSRRKMAGEMSGQMRIR